MGNFENIEPKEKSQEGREEAERGPEIKRDPNRDMALALGGLELGAIRAEKDPQKRRAREKVPLPLDVTIGDLREQQNQLAKEKKGLQERGADFKKREKDMLRGLSDFHGEDRALLRSALAWKINFEAEKIDPKRQEAFETVLGKFDESRGMKNSPPEARQAQYLAAYTVLSEEEMIETENTLHGTREASFKSATDVSKQAEEVGKLFANHKDLAPRLSAILADQKLGEGERERHFAAAVNSIDDPRSAELLTAFRKSLKTFAEQDARMETMGQERERLERRMRGFKEFTDRSKENPEHLLAPYGQLEEKKKESFERKETPPESRLS